MRRATGVRLTCLVSAVHELLVQPPCYHSPLQMHFTRMPTPLLLCQREGTRRALRLICE